MQRGLRAIEPRRTRVFVGRYPEHLFGDDEEVAEVEVLDRHSASRSRTRWFCSITARTLARNALSLRLAATRSAIACRISSETERPSAAATASRSAASS